MTRHKETAELYPNEVLRLLQHGKHSVSRQAVAIWSCRADSDSLLLTLLDHPHGEVRKNAVQYLVRQGKISNSELLPHLLDTLADDRGDEDLVKEIYDALKWMGPAARDALPVLRDRLCRECEREGEGISPLYMDSCPGLRTIERILADRAMYVQELRRILLECRGPVIHHALHALWGLDELAIDALPEILAAFARGEESKYFGRIFRGFAPEIEDDLRALVASDLESTAIRDTARLLLDKLYQE